MYFKIDLKLEMIKKWVCSELQENYREELEKVAPMCQLKNEHKKIV